MVRGRFAPSPTGRLHVGNLRTALASWLASVREGGDVVVRIEDLDRANSSPEHASGQLQDLRDIGLEVEEAPWRQSERFGAYDAVIAELTGRGLTYPCYCTRREILEAASAPHGPEGAYPGTCRELDGAERRRREESGRPAAIRLRSGGEVVEFDDRLLGRYTGRVDDVVLRRNDGVPAYNLAVVVDDAEQGVTQVVRGDDLAPSTPRQILLQRLLGLPTPEYGHVPLVLGPDRERLAKRHGAVTLDDLRRLGIPPDDVRDELLRSLGLPSVPLFEAASIFEWERVPRDPWIIPSRWQTR